MNEFIALRMGTDAARALATSAMPDAPTVAHEEPRRRVRTARGWTAARLRGMARGTYHLANRVDPVCLPERRATA